MTIAQIIDDRKGGKLAPSEVERRAKVKLQKSEGAPPIKAPSKSGWSSFNQTNQSQPPKQRAQIVFVDGKPQIQKPSLAVAKHEDADEGKDVVEIDH